MQLLPPSSAVLSSTYYSNRPVWLPGNLLRGPGGHFPSVPPVYSAEERRAEDTQSA